MKITNIRCGFATNSSSAHSIMTWGKNAVKEDDYQKFEYGWEYFLLSSKEAKLNYFLTIAISSIKEYCDCNSGCKKCNKQITELFEMFGLNSNNYDELKKDECHIDHQSKFYLPVTYTDRKKINLQFFKELIDPFINNANIVIVGGNDNDDNDKDCDEKQNTLTGNGEFIKNNHTEIIRFLMNRKTIIRENENTYTIFNSENGTKIRISKTGLQKSDCEESVFPELLDIKITNNCKVGCSFCYQSSNICKEPILHYSSLVDVLHKAEILEVAIGGGDPLEYPYINYVAKSLNEEGISVSLSTANLEILRYNHILDFSSFSAIGISIHNIILQNKLDEYLEILESTRYNHDAEIVLQLIAGDPRVDIKKIYKKIQDFRILILGPKYMGRGQGYEFISSDDKKYWKDLASFIKKSDEYIHRISVDTALINLIKPYIDDADKRTYHLSEGKYSKYMDLTTGEIKKMSYTNDVLGTFEPIKMTKYLSYSKEDVEYVDSIVNILKK